MRGESYTMRELEKLKAGLDFCFDDRDIASLKENAILQCAEYNSIHNCAYEMQYVKLKEMPGSVGEEVGLQKLSIVIMGKTYSLAIIFSVAIILQYLTQEKSLSAIMS
jgi:maltose O-acetyltransferase